MKSIAFTHDGTFGSNGFFLGDGVLAMSVFNYFKEVEWIIPDKSHVEPSFNAIFELYKDQFDVKVTVDKHAWNSTEKIVPDVFAQENGIRMVRPNGLAQKSGSYVTVQTTTNKGNSGAYRELHEPEKVEALANGREIVDLSIGLNYTLHELFSIVASSELHIGIDSGISWVAAATNTPTQLFLRNADLAYDNSGVRYTRLLAEHDNVNVYENMGRHHNRQFGVNVTHP